MKNKNKQNHLFIVFLAYILSLVIALFFPFIGVILSSIVVFYSVYSISLFLFNIKIPTKEEKETETSQSNQSNQPQKFTEADERIIKHPNGDIVHARRLRQWN